MDPRDRLALIALRRFGLGARPGDVALARSDPRGYVLAQIEGDGPGSVPGITPVREGALLSERFRRRLKLEREGMGTAEEHARAYRRALLGDIHLWLEHVIATPHGFAERLAMFWSNHLTVSTRTSGVPPLRGDYENEVARAHALGSFESMVEASSRHPAMLLYLDQARSIGPDSRAGKRRDRGLNENYARELLELHTLGVDGGYTQDDVRTLALLLTGWTLRSALRSPEDAGRAVFVRGRHQPGPHRVLGRSYGGDPEAMRGRVIADLVRHPATARHVARKMAAAFVSAKSFRSCSSTVSGTARPARAAARMKPCLEWTAPRRSRDGATSRAGPIRPSAPAWTARWNTSSQVGTMASMPSPAQSAATASP